MYTQQFNRQHNRAGHLVQGRFKSILVDRDAYLLELCRYIVLNPVRAKMVERPGDYTWSSYCATAGLSCAPDFLDLDWILSQFAPNKDAARIKYVEFVSAGIGAGQIWTDLKSNASLAVKSSCVKLNRHSKINHF